MFNTFLLTVFICSFTNNAFCTEKRLIGTQQNNSCCIQMESVVSKLQKRLTDLEVKVANSVEHMVGFTACHTKSATLGDGQTVLYDKVISNLGQAYNAMDGEFRAPYTGLYSFSLTGMAYSITDIYLHLVKNGINIGEIYSNAGFADSSTITFNLHLQSDDEVWVKNGGGGRLHHSDYNCFSGMLIREG